MADKVVAEDFEVDQNLSYQAVDNWREKVLRKLLEREAEPDRDELVFNNRSPLFQATHKGHAGVMELVLESEKGVGINMHGKVVEGRHFIKQRSMAKRLRHESLTWGLHKTERHLLIQLLINRGTIETLVKWRDWLLLST